jgi:hypothetical protein
MDYMSDTYLKEAEPESGQKKRGRQQLQSNTVQPMGKKQILEHMHSRREEGLQTKLDETNKGYKLLQKMGYTKGSGLGKNETGSEDPVRVSVREKADRLVLFAKHTYNVYNDFQIWYWRGSGITSHC